MAESDSKIYKQAEPVSPPDAVERAEPLPSERPKSIAEDAGAAEKLAQILAHPAYRRADQDFDFLDSDATRGVRLELDYLKTELELQRAGIRHTIVVFGGTRIQEPKAAEREVAGLRAQLAAHPDGAGVRKRLERAERRLSRAHFYEVARRFGHRVAHAGEGPADSRLVVMTGGGPGIMEAANRGAHDAGAKSIGLNIDLPREQFPNPYVSPELSFRMRYFALRKLHFLLRARALVAFPGGYGTLDEVFETLTLIQTRKLHPIPIVLVGEAYWRRVVDFDVLLDEGMIDAEDLDLFWFRDDADGIWESIVEWYERAGRDLFDVNDGVIE